jgi:N-formylglutamate deformylase
MSTSNPPVITLTRPSVHAVPVVFDSPHSGTWYPEDFRHKVAFDLLRMAEDTHVEKLYEAAPRHGATLIAANFPRSYIDANRNLLDIDNLLLDKPWPGPVNPSKKTEKGIGLVWRKLDTGDDIYDRKLSVAEVMARIKNCHAPYHAAVRDALNEAVAHYGGVWHLNCHSMPAVGGQVAEDGPGKARADFVLGDRDGTSASPEFTAFVAEILRGFGYDVKINDPYKGVELVRAYSDPANHRHSLQIEINRRLYMNEKTREPNAQYASLKGHIDALIEKLCAYAVAHAPGHHHAHCDHDHGHGHAHAHDHKHEHKHAAACAHEHEPGHVHGPDCNHDHGHAHGHSHAPATATVPLTALRRKSADADHGHEHSEKHDHTEHDHGHKHSH